MKEVIKLITGVAGLLILAACTSPRELETVDYVNLEKYEGVWYDIAHLPQNFLDDCKCITAVYKKSKDHLKVVNNCVKLKNGKRSKATGKIFPIGEAENSKLKVQFFWPFKERYNIIALEDDYSYAMIGTPDRESLWILSRDPQPSALLLKRYLNKAEGLGFETSQLIYTDQSCHAKPIRDE